MWNFRIIKSITNNKKNCKNIPMIQIDGKTTTHYQTIVEKFNNYNISVADNINNGNFPKNTTDDLIKINPLNYLYSAFKQPFINIALKNVTTYEIEKIIKELKNKNSCGYDEVTVQILKINSPCITLPLTYICNGMLTTGTFPDKLNFFFFLPMYKKVTKHLFLITGQSLYFPFFQKILKKKCMNSHTTT
jgi:hypothetical protein